MCSTDSLVKIGKWSDGEQWVTEIWIYGSTVSLLTAVSKVYLIKRQTIFRFADSAFPQLYCLIFSCK